jgi:hypothetical protein
VACLDQAVIGQQLEGLAQCHDADPELGRELLLGWQGAAGRPLAASDAVGQVAVDAQVFWLAYRDLPPGRADRRAPAGCP